MGSTMKRAAAVAACALAVASIGTGAAQAGEITGNGEYIHGEHFVMGKSECAFSGQNDEYRLGDTSAPKVQSFGHTMRAGGAPPGTPGFACNPSGKR